MKLSRPVIAAALAVAAAGASSVAQARDNVYFSIDAQVAPGLSIGASNYAPRYYAPPPVYYRPAPVYYEPAPVYYEPAPVVWGPRTVYYSGVRYYWSPEVRRHYYFDHKGKRHWRKHHRDHDHD